MQDQGIVGLPGASVPSGSVFGLGVCDVWRLELSAGQWPWLADELVGAPRRLSDQRARARLAATADAARSWVQAFVDCQDLDAFSFEPLADPLRLS